MIILNFPLFKIVAFNYAFPLTLTIGCNVTLVFSTKNYSIKSYYIGLKSGYARCKWKILQPSLSLAYCITESWTLDLA